MENKKEMPAFGSSVGADERQTILKCTDHSISDSDENIKSFEEMQRELLRQLDPSYLKTVSMTTLYDTVFEIQPPLIDGLLQRGTYLFVGSPKVGKSFMMAQIAYHISTGTSLWEYKVRKATVLYFGVEPLFKRMKSLVKTLMVRYFQTVDDYQRLNQTNASLYRSNERLKEQNKQLTADNNHLWEEIKDYKLLRKVFGNRQIDSLLEQARQSKQRGTRFRNKENER